MGYTKEFYERFPEQQRKTLKKLEDDIAKAEKIRKEEGLILDIKREEARLAEIQKEQAAVIENAKVEVVKITEAARQEAVKILAESQRKSNIETEVAERLMKEAKAAQEDAEQKTVALMEWEGRLSEQGKEQHQKYLNLVKMETDLKKTKDSAIEALSVL